MHNTLQSTLTRDKAALESVLSLDPGTARIEVQMLLQHVLCVSRAYLLAHPEQVLNEAQAAAYCALLQRRLRGEPLAYILGEREFFGLDFRVSPATLIPRPDTELLVELVLQRMPEKHPPPQFSDRATDRSTMRQSRQVAGYPDCWRGRKCRVLDLGTGSGAIALSIAHARPDADVTAVDASTAALEVAQFNARRLNIGNVRLLHSDWFAALHGERFDLIVSNPPYIAAADEHLAQGDVRFEPRSALASGADGLDDIRRITTRAQAHLNSNGWLMFEHGYNQAAQVRALLQQAGFADVFSARDLAGIERVSGGRQCAG